MTPLLRAIDNPRSLNEARVRVIDDPNINAANAGGGEFQITTGLLAKANDDHLRGVLAHEIAHEDAKEMVLSITLKDGSNVKYLVKSPQADALAAARKEGISNEKVSSYEISQLGTTLNIGESPLPLGLAVKIAD